MKEATHSAGSGRRVWDLPLRVFHWTLLVAVFGAWLTRELEGDWFAWHTRFGYAVLVLIVWRILWGMWGTRHARFVSFVRGPGALLQYLRQRPTSIGHSPLAALAVLLMLAILLGQALTGLFSNDQVLETGPLFGYVDVGTSDRLTTIHRQLFDIIAIVIGLHVAAVFIYLFVKGENLLWPMFTGRKSNELVPASEEIGHSRWPLAIVLLTLIVGALIWLVRSAPQATLFSF